jgi:hypothetical protein
MRLRKARSAGGLEDESRWRRNRSPQSHGRNPRISLFPTIPTLAIAFGILSVLVQRATVDLSSLLVATPLLESHEREATLQQRSRRSASFSNEPAKSCPARITMQAEQRGGQQVGLFDFQCPRVYTREGNHRES